MIDRLLRFALVIAAIAFLRLTAEAGNPSPSFGVRIEGQGPGITLIPGFVSSGAVWDDVAGLTVVVFALGFPLGWEATQHWRPWPAVNFAAFIATLAVQYTVWLPRILRRRFEAEMREDPVSALARRRREHRTAIVG